MLSGVESVRLAHVPSEGLEERVAELRAEGTEALKRTRAKAEEQAEVLGEAERQIAEAREQLRAAQDKQKASSRRGGLL